MRTTPPLHFGRLLTATAPPGSETFEPILEEKEFRLERIVTPMEMDLPGPWYDQPHDEWALVVQGCAVLEFDGGLCRALSAGDYIHLPAHCLHRVVKTDPREPVVWLALHWTRLSTSDGER
ncbi:MAG TPA: cupin domain-containing protein [Verrucomicrobiales bacterium]|nr:cupin domain-containing protein [Verrucomicrobiales bacterium]